MTDFSSIQALLEKHRPPDRPQLPPAAEIRVAVVRQAIVGNRGKRPHAEGVIKVAHALYMSQSSQKAAAALVGCCRSNLTALFARHGLPSKRKLQPRIVHNGVTYAFDGSRYYRQCGRGCQHIYLHKIMWAERHGSIPAGHRLIIVDGAKAADFSDANVKLVTEAQYWQHVIGTRWARYRAKKEAA